jgi:hypothetical protein
MSRIALLAVTILAHPAFFVKADGTVNFRNDAAFITPADRLVRDADGLPLVGTNYMAQLYYGPSGVSPSSLNPVTAAPAPFRPSGHMRPGTWAGGTRTLSGFFAGETVHLEVRVWDSSLAASYEEALTLGFGNTQHGESSVFTYVIPIPPDPSWFWDIDNFRGFTLVPEPSVALLGLIGIVGLYFWHRGRP